MFAALLFVNCFVVEICSLLWAVLFRANLSRFAVQSSVQESAGGSFAMFFVFGYFIFVFLTANPHSTVSFCWSSTKDFYVLFCSLLWKHFAQSQNIAMHLHTTTTKCIKQLLSVPNQGSHIALWCYWIIACYFSMRIWNFCTRKWLCKVLACRHSHRILTLFCATDVTSCHAKMSHIKLSVPHCCAVSSTWACISTTVA